MKTASQGRIRNFWLTFNGLLLAVAMLSGVVAWWLIAWPVASFSNVDRHAGHFAQTFGHMIGGTAMLLLGGANLYLAATRRSMPLHRLAGRAYLVLGSLASLLAINITLSTAHKPAGDPILSNASTSLAMLAFAWLVAMAMGWRAIRNRRFPAHRDWMIRSYVLVWSFVFCRLASRVPEVNAIGGGDSFIWLSWVGPLMLCEIGLQWQAGSKQKAA